MLNSKSRNYGVDIKTGFYSPSFFDMRLREERHRTERSGSPFSLLTLDISDLADLLQNGTEFNIHQIKEIITNIVQENTRGIDVKTWYDHKTLKILMPGTERSGAGVLAEKLEEMVNHALETSFGLKSGFDLKKNMIITSYPEIIRNSVTGPENKRENTRALSTEFNSHDQMALVCPLYSDLSEKSVLYELRKSIKRGIDIIGSLIGIILFLPLMLIIAILIKLTSPGPVLYKQRRMGFLGKEFTFLKFRSMYADCDERRHREYVKDLIKKKMIKLIAAQGISLYSKWKMTPG
ncbi:MAG TPA: diguanylate cyclase [Desulfobacteraceae bacterium]|nr:diguanylate cyclase [Desulfobacteraceae bacterium]